MLKLYYTPGACSLVSHIALEEAGAEYSLERIDFRTGEQTSPAFRAINPNARVPALVTEHGVITENIAILGYLALLYPDAPLAPVDDPFAFSQVQAFNSFIATTIHVAFRQISRPEAYADGSAAADALRRKVPALADGFFGLVEERLGDGRPFVHGAGHSVSDSYLFVFSNYLRLGDRGDERKLPLVIEHRERIGRRAAVRRVLAVEGLDAAWRDDRKLDASDKASQRPGVR